MERMDAKQIDFIEPYALLLLKVSRELEAMKENKPKTLEKLKTLLAAKQCYVTCFSAPYTLLKRCEQSETFVVDNQSVLKVFPFYEIVSDRNDAWEKPYHNMLKFIKYKSNSFHLDATPDTQAKVEQAVGDWIASSPDIKIFRSPKGTSTFFRKCIVLEQLDPVSVVRDLESYEYLALNFTGSVSYNLSGVDSDLDTSNSACSYEEYLKGVIVRRIKALEQRPKTAQALANFIKPFMNVLKSVNPSEIANKYSEIKHISKKFVIREFRLSINDFFQTDKSNELLKNQKYVQRGVITRGRGRGQRRGRGRGNFRGNTRQFGSQGGHLGPPLGQKKTKPKPHTSIVDVLLKYSQVIDAVSNEWNAPLCPTRVETGVERVAQWMKNKSLLFDSGFVSTHRDLLHQALQSSLYREQVPLELVLEKLEQYEIIHVSCVDEINKIDYDFDATSKLRLGEAEIKQYQSADTHNIVALKNKLEFGEGTHPVKSIRGKRGVRGGVRGRKKRGRYGYNPDEMS